ncbi:MAG: hypothetical protein Unbinned4388contig1000_42 [Prokaryotic dsDNA virus sp.]|nr:MAG: hypothetical protein Unbinned4388contig1000_42 [Prokaryotic dsDNA virus sp.]|tara:strand:- start:60776 stop:61177 length:402 start_codon:yes stop_codon:yes gene_type:complete
MKRIVLLLMMVVATVVNAQEIKDIRTAAFSVGRSTSLNKSLELAKEADWIMGKQVFFEDGSSGLVFITGNMGNFYIIYEADKEGLSLSIDKSEHDEGEFFPLQESKSINDKQMVLSFFTELGFYSIYVQLTEE